MNEQSEYLAYYPEDSQFFEPYELAYNYIKEQIMVDWFDVQCVVDQKAFAMLVKDKLWSSALFQAKKSGGNPVECFTSQSDSYKIKVLGAVKEKLYD